MDQNQKNEGIQSRCVLELYESCEKGSFTKIKKLLEDELYSRKTLDTAMRKCMRNRKRDHQEYHDSLNLLLQYIDVNFKNPIEEDSTIMMMACKISDVNLVELILEFDFSLNQSFSKGVDLMLRDENSRNFMHYLVNKETQEEDACEVFDRFMREFDMEGGSGNAISASDNDIMDIVDNDRENSQAQVASASDKSNHSFNISKELNSEDKFGYTPLGLSLQNGWAQLSRRFILAKSKALVVISTQNNLIHLAVLGQNLNCIKLILTYCTVDELRHKNKDQMTPRELAKSLNLNYYANIIENYEENCFNPSFISIFCDQSTLLVSDILEKFYLEDYSESLFLLNQLKINQSILNSPTINSAVNNNSNNKNSKNKVSTVISNPNIEWNIFLTKFHIKLASYTANNGSNTNNPSNTHDATISTLSTISKGNPLNSNLSSLNLNLSSNLDSKGGDFEITPENILSKFITNRPKEPRRSNNVLHDFSEFFNKIDSSFNCFTNTVLPNTPNTPNTNDESHSLDIIIYNKGIFYYKQGDFIKIVQIFSNYLKLYLPQNDTMYYKWFIYVNISFILIEGLITLKFTKLVACIIERLEEFLFTHIRIKKDEVFTNELIAVRDYLNSKEVINQFSPTWDESFCLVNLYKAMMNIYQCKIEDAKLNLKEFKKLYKNCSYKEEVRIMHTLYNFYRCLKVKMYYYSNNFTKCLNGLSKIHKLTLTEHINIRINEHKIERRFPDNEYIIFYLNSMGVIYLKQKKFVSAEIFFKAGISHFRKIYVLIERYDFTIKLSYIYSLKYNLALCYFYQKQYEKAHIIFREISKNKNINTNIFLWYRLGLCCLEIEMMEVRVNRKNTVKNDIIVKVLGYDDDTNSNLNSCVHNTGINSLGGLMMNNLNNLNMNKMNIIPNEEEEDDDDIIETVNLNFIDDEDTPVAYNAKRIILENKSPAKSKKRIHEAISHFKKVVQLIKANINSNSRLNESGELSDIYSFYFGGGNNNSNNNSNNSNSNYSNTNNENTDSDKDKFTHSEGENGENNPLHTAVPKTKSFNLIVNSTYLNLIYSLSLTENWTEVIFFCDQFERSEYFKNESEAVYKVDNYKIEAFINLRRIDKAMELIKSEFNNSNPNPKGSFYSRLNCSIYNEVPYRIALNVNMAKIHFINGDIGEADKCISNIVTAYGKEIPPYVLNLVIYSNLVKGNTRVALNYMKYKKAGLNYTAGSGSGNSNVKK